MSVPFTDVVAGGGFDLERRMTVGPQTTMGLAEILVAFDFRSNHILW
jgi:hypothetical protein